MSGRRVSLGVVLLGFAAATALLAVTNASLIRSKNEMTVRIGRVVTLHPMDLQFQVPDSAKDKCKVEVIQTDPITQRVGQMTPKVGFIDTQIS